MGSARGGKVRGTYGTGRAGVYIRSEIKKVPAYAVLSKTERLILGDMLRIHAGLTGGDTKPCPEAGFPYCWAHCLEDVGEDAFLRGRRRLRALGWFNHAPHQPRGPGAPVRWIGSTSWRTWEPKPDTGDAHLLKRHEEHRRAKTERIRAAQQKRTDFIVDNLKTKPTRSNNGDRVA